jgi:hypothetical protein
VSYHGGQTEQEEVYLLVLHGAPQNRVKVNEQRAMYQAQKQLAFNNLF